MSLEEIRARLDAATPGPWEAYRNDREVNMWVLSGDGAMECNLGYLGNRPENDAEFIAHAPEDMARLLGAVEAVLGLASKAPRFTVFGGESTSGIIAADDVINAITTALEGGY